MPQSMLVTICPYTEPALTVEFAVAPFAHGSIAINVGIFICQGKHRFTLFPWSKKFQLSALKGIQVHPGNVMLWRHWVCWLPDSDAKAIALETASYREDEMMSNIRCLWEKLFHCVTAAIRGLRRIVGSNVDYQAPIVLTQVELRYRQ